MYEIVSVILGAALAAAITVPVLFLWDLTAFIVFIAFPKSKPEKRRKAETGFIISSIALTVGIVLTAALFALAFLLDSL
ncbi:MAG: hypothetical protein NC253_12035 [Ruminococcus sp.]|nr:hypothetical protein [Ruminococcus sp.]MCM1478744.1 hypothetical protein [Muribaculaceae bacterium]